MQYINAKEAAEKWGVSDRRVRLLCSEGKITGAQHLGKQWILPADAPRPQDGRTKAAKQRSASGNNATPYRFPVFIFSKAFTERSTLGDDEKILLEAQILYLKGRAPESIAMCYGLLEKNTSFSLRFGAYATIAYGSMVLGMHSQYKATSDKLSELCNTATGNKEDYRLILAGLLFHVRWNAAPLLSIDASQISSDAILYYNTLLVLHSTFSSAKESPNALMAYILLCRSTDLEGILPGAVMLHLQICLFFNNIGDTKQAEKHARIGCRIAVQNGWVWYLSKYYFSCPQLIERYATLNGRSYLPQIKEYAEKNLTSLRLIQTSEGLPVWAEGLDNDDCELLHLIIYGLTNTEIAGILRTSQQYVTRKIKHICTLVGVSDRKALKSYAEAIFQRME